MNSNYRSIVASAICAFPVFAHAGNGVLDLTQLANYANQPIPAYITRSNTTAGNSITDKGATLGRVMFHDKRLSRNNSISCSSCHVQSRAFGDSTTASTGVNGTTGRHSMRLINARFANETRFFWDERAATLEAQTTQPIRDHVEMGFSGTSGDPAFADLVTKLAAIPEYRVLFAMAFGSPSITETRIQQSIAQFVRSIQSFDSRYDAGRAVTADNQPFANFTAQENTGKQLFLAPPAAPGGPPGGAGCAGCHAPPEFDIDPNSRNNGVTGKIGGGTDLTNTRAPSLRDLIRPGGQPNGGFMHDASFATLAQVINHYNLVPSDNADLDPRLRRPGGLQNLALTQGQKDAIVAFLGTLSGSAVYTDQRWSNPFDGSGQLSLIVLPAEQIRIVRQPDGTAIISCQAAAGMNYLLQTSADLKSWSNVATVTADPSGKCTQSVSLSGNAFYRYAYETP